MSTLRMPHGTLCPIPTFNFLPGNHMLSKRLTISGLSNVALVASNNSGATIDCVFSSRQNRPCGSVTGSSLSFTEVSGLTLKHLRLVGCNFLALVSVVNLTMVDVFLDTSGYNDLYVCNVFGSSVIIGLKTNFSKPDMYDSFMILIEYTDSLNQSLSSISPNQLMIRDTSFNLATELRYTFQQSTYTASLTVDNVVFTSLSNVIQMISQSLSKLSIKNSHFSSIQVYLTDNIVSTASFHMDNCHLVRDSNQSQFSIFDFKLLSTEVTIEDTTFYYAPIDKLSTIPFLSITNGLKTNGGSERVNFLARNVTFSGLTVAGFFTFIVQSVSIVYLKGVRNVTFVDCKLLNSELFLPAYRGLTAASVVAMTNSENTNFTDCEFAGNNGSAIVSWNSSFILSGNNTFSNNSAYQGGGLAIFGRGYVLFSFGSSTLFQSNSAEDVGGAMYVQHAGSLPDPSVNPACALRVKSNCTNHDVYFINNTALYGGSAIYGTSLDTCQSDICSGTDLIVDVLHFSNDSDFSIVTSDPVRVCLCVNGLPSCGTVFSNLTAVPGEEFLVSAVLVGDTFGTVGGSVYAQLLPLSSSEEVVNLGELQDSQQVGHHQCTDLAYTVYSNSSSTCIVLTSTQVPVRQYPDEDALQ